MKLALGTFAVACAVATTAPFAVAAPYASGVSVTGTAVSFTLNEGGSALSYSINGGPAVSLDGTAAGTKSFSLGSASDTFAITASKQTSGYRIGTGTTLAAQTNGMSGVNPTANFVQISDPNNPLYRFNSVRGVSVNTSPNSGVGFGTAYVANSAASTAAIAAANGLAARDAAGDGMFAIKADGSDGYGYGNVGQVVQPWVTTPSASSPWKVAVAADGKVYASDFADSTGNVWRFDPNLTNGTQMLAGLGGPTSVPAGQNHGSTIGIAVTGSGANTVIYTTDEDLTPANVGGTGTAKLNVWRYDVGLAAEPYAANPAKVNTNSLLVNAVNGLARGADGKTYVSQNRSGGAEAGIFVIATDGSVAYDTLAGTRALTGNAAATDLFTNVYDLDVSPDQAFMAVLFNNGDVAVVPLVNGIPDLANRVLVDTGVNTASGRDIAFDAAGNLYFASSGRSAVQVMTPGGLQTSTLTFDGTSYAFAASTLVPEPTTLAALAGLGLFGLVRRRKA